MKAFFDTSVLIAAFLADHEHHAASLKALAGTPAKEGGCAAHTLAEVYATLTRLPGPLRVAPEHALLFLNDLSERLHLITLTAAQYQDAVAAAAKNGVAGGAIYDALILQCAIKSNAATILTWNLRDFRRIAPNLAPIIKTPG